MIAVRSEVAGRATGSTVLASRSEARRIQSRPSAFTSRKCRNGLRPKSSSLINRRQPGYDYRNHQTRGLGAARRRTAPRTRPHPLPHRRSRCQPPDPATQTRQQRLGSSAYFRMCIPGERRLTCRARCDGNRRTQCRRPPAALQFRWFYSRHSPISKHPVRPVNPCKSTTWNGTLPSPALAFVARRRLRYR